ncbi:uncharacterized protein DS421_3g59820 [Arachis hypogaea]|nr:uncharacterized protein DS421_3g59820 [Arachis hypogaea]
MEKAQRRRLRWILPSNPSLPAAAELAHKGRGCVKGSCYRRITGIVDCVGSLPLMGFHQEREETHEEGARIVASH